MPDIDLEYLEMLARRVPTHGTIVEVGSFKGRSSWTLARSCDPSVKVYCIDLWDDIYQKKFTPQEGEASQGPMYEEFLFNVRDCPNIIPIRGNSTDISWPEKEKVDLVFIDGDHTSPQVDKDIALWVTRLTANGVLSGHDFKINYYPDVCRAVLRLSVKLKLPIKVYGKGFIWAIEMLPIPPEKEEWIVPSETLDLIESYLKELGKNVIADEAL
jgi:hypothetical protein